MPANRKQIVNYPMIRLFLLVIAIETIHDAFAQRQSTFTVYYALFDEFDFAPSIQRTVSPSFANIEKYRSTRQGQPQSNRYHFPWSYGLSYSRMVNRNVTCRFNWLPFYEYSAWSPDIPKVTGQPAEISYTSFSADYIRHLWWGNQTGFC